MRKTTAGQRETSRSLRVAPKLKCGRQAEGGHHGARCDQPMVEGVEVVAKIGEHEDYRRREDPQRFHAAPLERARGHPHDGGRQDHAGLPEGVDIVVAGAEAGNRDDDAEAHDELRETPPAGERARGLLPPGEDENETQDRRHRDGDERDGRHVEEH